MIRYLVVPCSLDTKKLKMFANRGFQEMSPDEKSPVNKDIYVKNIKYTISIPMFIARIQLNKRPND